jgi:hypothetical protein
MENINEQNYDLKQFDHTFGLFRYTNSEIEYFSNVINLLMSRSDIKKIFPEPITITNLINELKDVVKPSDLWEALSSAYRKNMIPIKPANILFDKIREKKGLTMDYFEEELIYESKRDKALSKKAKLSGIPKSILSKVYSKGLAAWKGGHRPGVPQHQWAMGRVNSFITGAGGARKADADLWAKARKSKARKKKKKHVKEDLDILRLAIRNLIKESIGKNITCSECGWKWNTSESAKSDMYVCHKCGHDNKPKK